MMESIPAHDRKPHSTNMKPTPPSKQPPPLTRLGFLRGKEPSHGSESTHAHDLKHSGKRVAFYATGHLNRVTASQLIQDARASLKAPKRPVTRQAMYAGSNGIRTAGAASIDFLNDDLMRYENGSICSRLGISQGKYLPPLITEKPHRLQKDMSTELKADSQMTLVTPSPRSSTAESFDEVEITSVPKPPSVPVKTSPRKLVNVSVSGTSSRKNPMTRHSTSDKTFAPILQEFINVFTNVKSDFIKNPEEASVDQLRAYFSSNLKEISPEIEHVVPTLIQWMQDSESTSVAIACCGLLLYISASTSVLTTDSDIKEDETIPLNCCQLLYKLSNTGAETDVTKSYEYFLRHETTRDLYMFVQHRVKTLYLSSPSNADEFFGMKCRTLTFALATLQILLPYTLSSNDLLLTSLPPAIVTLSRLFYIMTHVLRVNDRTDKDFLQAVGCMTHAAMVLKYLAEDEELHQVFLSPLEGEDSETGTPLEIILDSLESTYGFIEVEGFVNAVVRLVSKLSVNEQCLTILGKESYCHSYIEIFLRYHQDEALTTRLCFILANLTTSLCERHTILKDAGVIEDIVALFGMTCESFLTSCQEQCTNTDKVEDADSEEEEESRSDPETLDLIIKLIRLINNLALDPEMGKSIVNMNEMQNLADLLECAVHSEDEEELQLNIVSCFANLSYYISKDDDLFHVVSRLFTELPKWLMSDNEEVVIESLRYCANLSRIDSFSELISCRILEILTCLLDSDSPNILFHTCGALMNLSLSFPEQLSSHGTVSALVQLTLERIASRDYKLATVTCKVLYNYFLHARNPVEEDVTLLELIERLTEVSESSELTDDAFVVVSNRLLQVLE